MSNIQSSRGNKRQREPPCGVERPTGPSPSSAEALHNNRNQHYRRHRSGTTQQIPQQQQRPRQTRAGEEGGHDEERTSSSNVSSSGINGHGQQDDPYGDYDFDFTQDVNDLPNDTMAAILTLQRQFYGEQTVAVRSGGGGGTGPAGRGRARTGLVLQHQMCVQSYTSS